MLHDFHRIALKCNFMIYIGIISATEEPAGDVEVLRPTNTIATVGSKITLPCTSRVNDQSRWDFYSHDAAKPKNIYNGKSFDANLGRRVTIDFNSCRFKTCHLSIESVQLEDAGHYVCSESSSFSKKAASLVVLGQLKLLILLTIIILVSLLFNSADLFFEISH